MLKANIALSLLSTPYGQAPYCYMVSVVVNWKFRMNSKKDFSGGKKANYFSLQEKITAIAHTYFEKKAIIQ